VQTIIRKNELEVMADFRAVLDDEVGKAVDDSIKKTRVTKPKRSLTLSKFFAFGLFAKLSFLLLFLIAAIAGWAMYMNGQTNKALQDRLASKTVLIEKAGGQTYRISDVVEPPPALDSFTPDLIKDGVDVETLDVISDEPSGDQASVQTDNLETVKTPIVTLTSGALAAAPIPDLFESTPEGIIPKARLSDGLTPFQAYKKPFVSSSNKPVIAFVAVNVGMSRKRTEEMINDLPSMVSLAFSPYAPDIKLLSDAARSAGHETWLMLPIENEGYPLNDPGPNTMLINASIEQNQARLLSTMGSAVGYVGLVSWPNHIFREKDVDTSPSVQQIFGRGLAILDSATASDRDFGQRIAYNNEFPFVKNNFWIDENLTADQIKREMIRISDYARASDRAVVLFYPYPKAIKAVKEWVNSPAAVGFELAPASYLAVYKDE